MKHAACFLGAITLTCIVMAPAAKAANPPIVNTTFETDPGDWRIINVTGQPTDAAKVGVTHEAAHVKAGKGSLKFDYTVKKGDTNLLMLPLQPPSLVKMQSMHFWIKPDHNTSMMLVVSEKDGGRYKTNFTCAGNSWQEVSVGLSDLVLSEDENDPKDPDGKLDTDQIDGIMLIDADCFLAQILGDSPPFLNFSTGAHTLYLNSFTVDDAPLTAPSAIPGELALTPLLRPQIDWMVIGNVSVQKSTEKPLTGASLKVTYTQMKGKIFAVLKQIKVGGFTGVTRLDFAAASKLPISLLVQMEDTKGNKFNTNIMLPGASQANDYTLKMADFTTSGDSKDPNASLDLSLVKQLILMDPSGISGADVEEKENSLWINKLRAIKK